MSRSGNVRLKSLYCGARCVLFAAALALVGCSGTGSPDGSSGEGAGSSAVQSAGQEFADVQEAGQEAAYETPTGLEPTDELLAGQDSADAQEAGLEASDGQPSGLEVTDEQLSGLELNDAQPAGPKVTAEQSVQEIVAETVRRRGRLPEVYDPNPAYDRYALVEYVVDDIGAEFTATVSAEDDGSEYEVHCTLGKTEQIVILDEDYNVIYDRTGSMGDDAPLIVQAAVEEDNWRAIGD